MEKYEEAKAKEHDTMIRSRQIAKNLNLDMKIGDVNIKAMATKLSLLHRGRTGRLPPTD